MPAAQIEEEVSVFQKVLVDKIYNLLRKQGPLCISQISAELVVSAQTLKKSLSYLVGLGLIVKRPDKNKHIIYLDEEYPYAIRRPFEHFSKQE